MCVHGLQNLQTVMPLFSNRVLFLCLHRWIAAVLCDILALSLSTTGLPRGAYMVPVGSSGPTESCCEIYSGGILSNRWSSCLGFTSLIPHAAKASSFPGTEDPHTDLLPILLEGCSNEHKASTSGQMQHLRGWGGFEFCKPSAPRFHGFSSHYHPCTPYLWSVSSHRGSEKKVGARGIDWVSCLL